MPSMMTNAALWLTKHTLCDYLFPPLCPYLDKCWGGGGDTT